MTITDTIKRHFFVATLWMLCTLSCFAQKMSVAKFYLAETDLTANRAETTVFDQNGDKCALIKVETTQRGFTFDGGSLGITKTEEHPGEIWVYVPHGLKRITISHPQLGILRNYDLGLSVQKARTYILELTTDKVMTAVFDDSQTQILELTVFPVNAEVIINGVRETPDAQGKIIKELSFGSYNCRVMADNYHPYESILTINDTQNRHRINIVLKQAFGYLGIVTNSEYNGAEVYLDDSKIGVLPLSHHPVKSGTHKVVITKPLYLPYENNIVVADSMVYELASVNLEPNFANVTIEAVSGSSVWVDNEFKGNGTWTGPLELGHHIIECRMESHRTTSKSVNISSKNAITFSCETPQPIYGSIHVTSTPANAEVYIDNVKVGTTPYLSHSVLVGKRNIRLVKEGYKTEERIVDIKEDESTDLSVSMSDYCNVKLESKPIGAKVYLDGKYQGTTPLNIQTYAGDYLLSLSMDGYNDYDKKVRLDGSTSNKSIKMKRKYIYPDEFHIGAGYRMGALCGIDVNIGWYISNFNVEFSYVLGMQESKEVYWSSPYLDYMPESVTYKFNGYTFRGGYGIKVGNRMRLTPQVGVNHIVLKEEDVELNDFADGAYVTCGVLSLHMGLALNRHIGLSLSPEYSFSMMESDGFEQLSSIQDITDKTVGFSVKGGVYLYF